MGREAEDGMSTNTESRSSGATLALRLFHVTGLVTLLTMLTTSGVLGQQTERAGEKEAESTTRLASESAPVELYVRNNNSLDARVYALKTGVRYRIGTVTSFTMERFELPRHIGADLYGVQLLVLPIGSNASHLTETISVFPGDALALEVEQHLPLSAFYRAY